MEERVYILLDEAQDIMSQLWHYVPPSRKKKIKILSDEFFECYDKIEGEKRKYRLSKRRVKGRNSAVGLL